MSFLSAVALGLVIGAAGAVLVGIGIVLRHMRPLGWAVLVGLVLLLSQGF